MTVSKPKTTEEARARVAYAVSLARVPEGYHVLSSDDCFQIAQTIEDLIAIKIAEALAPKPTIPEVLARFRAYHVEEPAWGSLHIVLDDRNLEDAHVSHCIEWARTIGDAEGEALGEILLRMSRSQRRRLARRA